MKKHMNFLCNCNAEMLLHFFSESKSNVYQMLLQLEECEETNDYIECIDVKNEWWVENPNFKEEF